MIAVPIDFIPCRLKGDHTITRDIAETALQHWPLWEPIPDDPDPGEDPAPTPEGDPARAEPPPPGDSATSPAATPPARKSRRAAADLQE